MHKKVQNLLSSFFNQSEVPGVLRILAKTCTVHLIEMKVQRAFEQAKDWSKPTLLI